MNFDNEKSVKELSARLEKLRQEKELTYAQLSARSNIDESNLSRILTGKVDFKATSLMKILKAFDIELVEII